MASVDIGSILDSIENSDPLAIDLKKRTRDALQKLGVPLKQAEGYASAVGFSVGALLGLVGLIVGILIAIADPLLRIFLRALTKARTETVAEQVDISASVLSEFLATEIDPAHIKTGKSGDQTIAAARGIGSALIDRLTQEFGQTTPVTPESGEKAAKTFAGYSINFAVQNTMISTLADALSFHLLEDFRELGVEVARNIGLGRLVRASLQPFIRNVIIEPYDQALRSRYRPDLLNEVHAIHAFNGGFLDGTKLHETLARKGWADDLHGIIIDENTPRLSDAELAVLVRNNKLSFDNAIAELGHAGITPATASLKMTYQDLQRADSIVATFKATLITQYVNGLIDEDQLSNLLDQLPLAKGEKDMEIQFATIRKQVPRAFLTWTEVENSFISGAADLDYVDAWLTRRGYSEEDQILKELLLLQKLDATVTKEQAAAAKKARKTGSG